MSKFTGGTIKPTSLLTHFKPTEGKLIVFSVIRMISAFAVLILFVVAGRVRHVPITFEGRIETTVAFRTIDNELKIVGLKGNMQTNPTLVSRSGDDTV
ncbi:MAG TPA: hypothetical protein VFR94_10435 [Nitrososphaeraceae archaeon]|nr:hypothetical protein [Nitrososphaeraceae archaeon]